jgi:hypothetical protein
MNACVSSVGAGAPGGLDATRLHHASPQLIEMHPLPLATATGYSGLGGIKSGLVALRNFDAAFDRFGSILLKKGF